LIFFWAVTSTDPAVDGDRARFLEGAAALAA
jgi:hypothetical protein